MQQPETKQHLIYDDINRVIVNDPFRWLEDANSIEVRSWINAQNEYTYEKLKDDNFKKIKNELANGYTINEFLNIIPANGRYFYRERKPAENQRALYVKEGLRGEPIKLVDPNDGKEHGTTAIDFWKPSPCGKYLLYGLSKGGNEIATIYIKNVGTRKNLPDVITNCRYSNIAWLADESGFFYIRNPRQGKVQKSDRYFYPRIYFHHLGDGPNNDELIFGKGRPKDDIVHIELSCDNKYLSIEASQKYTENEVFIYNLETKETELLITDLPSKFEPRFLPGKMIILTDHKTNNSRVLVSPLDELAKPIDKWDEFIPEKKQVLVSVGVSASNVFAEYLANASSRVSVFSHEGKELGRLPIPPYSRMMKGSARNREKEFFFGISSFTFPRITYRYDPETNSCEVVRKTKNLINADDYEVKQEWSTSKDGTRIPMFIFRRKGFSQGVSRPTILYGYGGFAKARTPYFMRAWMPWMKHGGVFVVANIRGGNEFGKSWHRSILNGNKHKTFEDFIAAAEYLVEKGHVPTERLGIMGESNGGLLVATVAAQRPDLFKAVVSLVPLTDMVRYSRFGVASRWAQEYGDPNKKEDLERILAWSPYHNIKKGVAYPNFLFVTADKDTRVDPLHARKMAALLQSVRKHNDIFLFSDTEVGHGPGKPVSKITESSALVLNFFSKKLGLET